MARDSSLAQLDLDNGIIMVALLTLPFFEEIS